MKDLVKINEVRKQLGVDNKTIRTWVQHGFLPCKKIGRCNYISRSDYQSVLTQFRTVSDYERLLVKTATEQQRLLDEYEQSIKQLREDMFLVSTMGHALNTKQLFKTIIQSNTLSEIEANVLTLMIEGYSFTDIAKQLHITNQLVRQRYRRALEKLESFMQNANLLQENVRLKQETSANNELIERLISENNKYRNGNVTATSSADYIFTMFFFLKRRIRRTDLSVRTYNALSNANILHIGDLLRLKIKDIRKIKGIHNKCCQEIKTYADRLGMSLGFNVEEINKQYKQIYGQVS